MPEGKEIMEAELIPAAPTTASVTTLTPAKLKKQLEQYGETRKVLLKFAADQMTEGSDYHVIKNKKSLGKPGAEKFCALFKVVIGEPELAEDIMATLPQSMRDAGAVVLKTKLHDQKGTYIGSGIGARTLKQDGGDVNKMMKMARKSSVVDAVISTFGLSDLFTQDLESMPQFQDPVQYPKPEQLEHNKKINKETGEITQKSRLTSRGFEMMKKSAELMEKKGLDQEERKLLALSLANVESEYDLTDDGAEIILTMVDKMDEQELANLAVDVGIIAAEKGSK